jgi:hypothetical protein
MAPGLSVVIDFATKRILGRRKSIAELVLFNPEQFREVLTRVFTNEVSLRIASRIMISIVIEECSPRQVDIVNGLVDLFLNKPLDFKKALHEIIESRQSN